MIFTVYFLSKCLVEIQKCIDRRHPFIGRLSFLLLLLCCRNCYYRFHSELFSHSQIFLCDNVRIIITQAQRAIVLEQEVFQIPFFDGVFALGMGLLALHLCARQLACSCKKPYA